MADMRANMISRLGGVFGIQKATRETLGAGMSRFAGRATNRAIARGGALGSMIGRGELGAVGNIAWAHMGGHVMRGAMYGAGVGTLGAAGGDVMGGDLSLRTPLHMLGGAFRGGLLGGLAGGAYGAGRMMTGRGPLLPREGRRLASSTRMMAYGQPYTSKGSMRPGVAGTAARMGRSPLADLL